jgi:hypothetical protein
MEYFTSQAGKILQTRNELIETRRRPASAAVRKDNSVPLARFLNGVRIAKYRHNQALPARAGRFTYLVRTSGDGVK